MVLSISAIFLILLLGLALGQILFSQKPILISWVLGLFFLFSLIIVLGSSLFYLWQFNQGQIILVVFAILLTVTLFALKNKDWLIKVKTAPLKLKQVTRQIFIKKHLINWLLVIVWFSLLIYEFFTLFQHQTKAAIRSPWEVLTANFFIVFFIQILILLIILINNRRPRLVLALITAQLFLAFSVATIIYSIGYGFDPFIHQASEKIILENGIIEPKPLQYIGQYVTVIFLSQITGLPLSLVDKWLLPLLAALALPALIIEAVEKQLQFTKTGLITVLSVFILPFTYFTSTVPFHLSLLFILALIFLSCHPKETKQITPFLWLLALAAFYIHPLGGLAGFIFLIVQYLSKKRKLFLPICSKQTTTTLNSPSNTLKKSLRQNKSRSHNQKNIVKNLPLTQGLNKLAKTSPWLIMLFLYPFAFLIIAATNPEIKINLQLPSFSLSPLQWQWLPFYSIYHQIYFFKYNLALLILIIFIIGWLASKKSVNRYPLVITAAILFINYILTKFITFSSLLPTEQQIFSDRILLLASLFLLPIIIQGLKKISQLLLIASPWHKILLSLGLATLLTYSLYLSYPRVDAFEKYRGYSTSSSDIKAVHWIAQDANNKKYVVLANQAVSAAAVKEFGFTRYYSSTDNQLDRFKINKLFYYPLPTGSPLYQIYLKMVYQSPNRSYAVQAMDLTGVDLVYFVVNNYWLDSEKIITQAKLEAIDFKNIDNGKIFIFKYQK